MQGYVQGKRKGKCKGGSAHGFHDSHDTYTLVHDTTGETLWFCDTCGLYTQARVCGMAKACGGPRQQPTPAWHALTRLREGSHPGLRRKVNSIPPTPWGRPIKGIHRLRSSLTKVPQGTTGLQPTAAAPVCRIGNLPQPTPSTRSGERQEHQVVEPDEDPFGPLGFYGSDIPEDEFGFDHDSFFGLEEPTT